MTIYSLYIFDKHCECVYYQGWHRTTSTRPGKDVLPGVAPNVSLEPEAAVPVASTNAPKAQEYTSPIPPRGPGVAVLPSTRSQQQAQLGVTGSGGIPPVADAQEPATPTQKKGLPFDEESKLVYGVLFSLRNMVKKLSVKNDEAFISYKTSTYQIHLYETPSGYKFVLFSDANVDSLRFVLKQIYQGAFVEFVIRNPMVECDSRISGKGIDSQAFRMSVNKFISELTVFR